MQFCYLTDDSANRMTTIFVAKFWQFDNTVSEFCDYFSLRMRRNAYFPSGQKSDLAIRFGDADFL